VSVWVNLPPEALKCPYNCLFRESQTNLPSRRVRRLVEHLAAFQSHSLGRFTSTFACLPCRRQSSMLCRDNLNGGQFLLLECEVFVEEAVAMVADRYIVG
jgi:hypothetical protein